MAKATLMELYEDLMRSNGREVGFVVSGVYTKGGAQRKYMLTSLWIIIESGAVVESVPFELPEKVIMIDGYTFPTFHLLNSVKRDWDRDNTERLSRSMCDKVYDIIGSAGVTMNNFI